MATITQKLERPVESPRILGPRIFPSNCWRMMIKTMKYRHFMGLSSRIMKAQGMAPRNGPKKGITLVTPTTTLTRGA